MLGVSSVRQSCEPESGSLPVPCGCAMSARQPWSGAAMGSARPRAARRSGGRGETSMITATPPAKMRGLFRGDEWDELCKVAADSYEKFAEVSPQDEQDVSTVAPTEFSMASPMTEVVASRSQRRHERRKQKKREKKNEERQETSTPEPAGARTHAEFCIHGSDSDGWVSAESDEEKLKRAVVEDQQDTYSDALSVGSEWEQRMNLAADLGLVDVWCTKNDVHMSAKEDHPAIVQAARRGDVEGVRRILDRNPEQVDAHRKRTEVEEREGYDKVYQWDDDTALITAARNGHLAVVEVLLEYCANASKESRAGVDDPWMKTQIEKGIPDAYRHQTAARAASMSRTLCKEAAKNMLSEKSSKPSKREVQTIVEMQDRLDQILDLLEFYESC